MSDLTEILYPAVTLAPTKTGSGPVSILYPEPEAKAEEREPVADPGEVADTDENPDGDNGEADDADPLEGVEGIDLDDPFAGDFRDAVKELGLDKEGAGKLVALESQHRTEWWEKKSEEWAEAARSEFGEDDFHAAKDLIRKYGDDELEDVLHTYGMGNHPAVIRFIRNVARGGK